MAFDPTTAKVFDPSTAVPVEPETPVTPSEPGVGKPTPYLEGLNDIPFGDLIRKGLDFPQTIRNLGSKALWSGAAESLPGVKTGYEPPTQAEKNVKTGGTIAGSIAQAGAGAGLGSLAAKGLKAPKAIETLLQLAGASAPGTTKAGIEGGPEAATKQGLIEMLAGGMGLGATKAIGAASPAVTRPLKSSFMGLMDKFADAGGVLPKAKTNAAYVKAALNNTSEGRALVKAVGEDEALKLISAGSVQPVKGKIGAEGINKAFDVGDVPTVKLWFGKGEKPDLLKPNFKFSPSVPLPNLIRDAEIAATARPGTTVGSMGKLETAKEEAIKVIDAVGQKGFQYQDVHDMRRAYQTLAFNEKDPTIKTFYQKLADGIGERAALGPKKVEMSASGSKKKVDLGGYSPSQMEETFGRAIKAEPKYLSQVAQNKVREEALKKNLIRWGIGTGATAVGLGAAKAGLSPIIEHMTAGNK
jgi:hypothetical protein